VIENPDANENENENATSSAQPPLRRSSLRSFIRWIVIGAALLWSLAALLLVAARWIDPPTTAVQAERRLEAWIQGKPYHKRYKFVPLNQISPDFQHAVIAAEDARFYQHHGFDWQAMEIAAEDDMEGGHRLRGGSTITQQLVKNLFFGTGRSVVRKGFEASLVPVAEVVLGKRRILELYLNVVEWGPGVYGAESACQLLLPNLGAEYGPRTIGSARRNFAAAPEAAPRSHESLQRAHPRSDAPNGLVIDIETVVRFIARHSGRSEESLFGFPFRVASTHVV
jgi:monofunctional glycosyltransferase